jgi:FMN phosphatase YigB (HAD superfamily)
MQKSDKIRIGIDFDNTIACYDGVFYQAALEEKIIPSHLSHSKNAVRDYLRAQNQEDSWTRLQGMIYGSRMDLARPFPGFIDFLQACKERSISLYIVSHKTQYPFLGPKHDLHHAARHWIETQAFPWIPPAHFELTLQEKLARIKTLGCTHFIDDLPEVLSEPNFPVSVKKILFDPNNQYIESPFQQMDSWKKLTLKLDEWQQI